MDTIFCSLCGKELKEEELNTCFNCGGLTCEDDYDVSTNSCRKCLDNSSNIGC